MHLLKDYLSTYYPISEELLEDYISSWSEYSYSKKDMISQPGKTERFLYFVKEGIQKSYYLNDGKQHIMFFAYAPSFSGIVESFLTQSPSKYYLENITDSKFLRISYTEHSNQLQKYRELETLFRKITESFLSGIIERHHELMAYNVEDRFRKFARRSGHLINKVPQKDIASYLRIDPTNFSKLINTINI